MSEQIENNFTYHAPTPESIAAMQALRLTAKDLAYAIEQLVPNSREKSLAITNLEQTVMWANAGIARNQ